MYIYIYIHISYTYKFMLACTYIYIYACTHTVRICMPACKHVVWRKIQTPDRNLADISLLEAPVRLGVDSSDLCRDCRSLAFCKTCCVL